MKMNEPDKRLSAESISRRSAYACLCRDSVPNFDPEEHNLRRESKPRQTYFVLVFALRVIKMQMGLSNKSYFNFSGRL
jgi:hypothetical protein